MANVAGRKKSIASNPGLFIDTPVANNNILNKAASQSTSLYQQCSSLRSRLVRIPAFSDFFVLSSSADSLRQSTDPVTQLWDCFSLGIPLCFLFNLLPPPNAPISIDTSASNFDASNERAKKHAIALFAMRIKQVKDCEQFTVTDLWERHSTDGLVKVVSTVTTIVDLLPPETFEPPPLSPPLLTPQESIDSLINDAPNTAVPANAREAARNNIVREMVETERKYVQDLEVMQKYANALSHSNTIDQDTIHLLFPGLNNLLNFQRKFLIRLEGTAEMPWKDQRWGHHFMEHEDDFEVYEPYCANYTSAVDLMLAEEQNLQVHNNLINAKSELPAFLIKPVQRICKYPLLLDSLIKASSPFDYPHYEELQAGSAAAKRIADKINEAQRREENFQTVKNLESRVKDWKGHHLSNFGHLLLDDIFTVTKSEVDREYHVFLFEKIILCCKEALPPPPNGKKAGKNNSILKKQSIASPTTGALPNKEKDTPLLLKGRIFLNNVTQAVPTSPRTSVGSSNMVPYSLAVWWKGDDDLEFFTLRCRSEEQLKQWESQINRLIKEVANRRASERNLPLIVSHNSHTSIPVSLPHRSLHPSAHDRASSSMTHSLYARNLPPHPASSRDHVTPQNLPLPLPPGAAAAIIPAYRPIPSRVDSNASISTDNSFTRPQRVPLHTQISSSQLRATYDQGEMRSVTPSPSPNVFPMSRSRSASQPSAYVPMATAPPVPSTSTWPHRSHGSITTQMKRGSGSSQSTHASSEESPNTSPITPFGSSESSLGGPVQRPSRSRTFESLTSNGGHLGLSPPVKVKVHYNEDIFVIHVPRSTDFSDLVDKVEKKIRLCGPRRDDSPLRVKYKDEDGDMISLRSTEDVQMAFESFRPGGQVVLYVT
ncbi:hypothetical protein V8B97DRAFT_2075448 [Scleroderma yunnanense]